MSELLSVLGSVPPKNNDIHKWHGLHGAASALSIVSAAKKFTGITLLIVNENNQVPELCHELAFFAENEIEVKNFPDWEVLPYDNVSPHQDIISSRLRILKDLTRIKTGIIVVSLSALLQKLPPKIYLDAHSLDFATGQKYKFADLSTELDKLGYHRTRQVMEHGEYAIRGEIVDIFPMGQKLPLRLSFFDDELESIKIFAPDNQLALNQLDKVHMLPASEIPLSSADIKIFAQNWQKFFNEEVTEQNHIYRHVKNGLLPAGIESYLPLFFANTATLFDYLPSNALYVSFAGLDDVVQNIHDDFAKRFAYKKSLVTEALLEPDKLITSKDNFFTKINSGPQINIQTFKTEKLDKSYLHFSCKPLVNIKFNHQLPEPMQGLLELMQDDARILFVSETQGLQQALKNMLDARNIKTRVYTNFSAFLSGTGRYGITTGFLRQGFFLPDKKIYLIPESTLFATKTQKRQTRPRKIDHDKIISNLRELHLDDPIVHLAHGVGRYRGLKILDLASYQSEFLVLEYANNDILYVPVSSLHLIHRYSGADSYSAPLHRLGSSQWAKAQGKVKKQAHDIAVELLEIYAKREIKSRLGILPPDDQYFFFAAEFPFELTADQQDAIDDIIKDMTEAKPMDRLICGDVGFGKTEVALRAAFLATQNSKQVAILVPTTLLAQQHFDTLTSRFASWPINIAVLSRFNTGKSTKTTLKQLESGQIDIVIGTHKLLSRDVKFKNLGLLIIDEEHKFGVKQKDKFKSLRAEIDILTLTATPIPRTLNLSISGIRDLSIIATAPRNRVAIKTFVQQWNVDLLRESVMREVRRGGQIYFVHNRVETINKVARELAALLPEVRLKIAHGQMPETELETVMKDFYAQKFSILLCTTIIENGLDIPTANTIIINQADRFGLAQLHQLRGRVGRSHHRAYAYLLVTSPENIAANAKKRLEAIESMEDLGIGFSLAIHDLEIRGAGELLGAGQSGRIHEVGFEMYNDILRQAINDLQNNSAAGTATPQHLEIDLGETAMIPEDYIPDINTRLVIYKRIANTTNEKQLDNLQIELTDRFGPVPEEVENLLITAKLKSTLQNLKLQKLNASEDEISMEFELEPNIPVEKLIKIIQEQPQKYKLADKNKFKINDDMPEIKHRVATINEWQRLIA